MTNADLSAKTAVPGGPSSCHSDGTNVTAVQSVYVHVPFCRHRCGYCDFTLVAGRDDLIGDYLTALQREITAALKVRKELQEERIAGNVKAGENNFDTLYLGGGTPTHLPGGQLSRLLHFLRQSFPLAEEAEFSIEANPADITAEKVSVLREAGVNRVSLGVQSFDAGVLRTLERDHTPATVQQAVKLLGRLTDNISFDLIFAVPGQSPAVWEATLREAVALQPAHLSTYSLTFEKGTAFWGRRRRGELVPLPEETERTMYAMAMDYLEAAGYAQYEISSFAQSGFRCRHNEVYWTGRPFLGFGPGAASYVNGRRFVNHRSVTTWLKRTLAGESAVAETEQLAPAEAARERLMLALRRTEGVNRAAFAGETGFSVEQLAAEVLRRHLQGGLLEQTGTHLRLSREGRFLADTVFVDLL